MHFLKAWSHVFLNVTENYVSSHKSYESVILYQCWSRGGNKSLYIQIYPGFLLLSNFIAMKISSFWHFLFSVIFSFWFLFLVLIHQNAKQKGIELYCHTKLLICSEYSVLSIPTQTDSSEYNISYQRTKPDLNREFKNSLL